MAKFDENLVTTEAVAWNDPEIEIVVRHDGQYAGIVKKASDSDYFICAASRERDGKTIQQACGQADSIEQGAKDVGQQCRNRVMHGKKEDPRGMVEAPDAGTAGVLWVAREGSRRARRGERSATREEKSTP